GLGKAPYRQETPRASPGPFGCPTTSGPLNPPGSFPVSICLGTATPGQDSVGTSQARTVPAPAKPIAGPSSAPQAPVAETPSSVPSPATSSAPQPSDDDDCKVVFARPATSYTQGVSVRFESILRRYYIAVGACCALAVTQRQALSVARERGEPPTSVADTLSAFVQ
ncbi:PREDICTED: vegetative cell wall protein gp1-like, partial [Vollenhovia emeryi]|uniref:vegetative cell wall protein gp1-like n=1 Tax=Vollenhovia emeryi TaxID=411798 RepID=UPI0005F4A6B2